MFYEEKQIEKNLQCPACKRKYIEPKCLPCGEVVCQSCIVEMQNDCTLNEFKCLFCDEMHCLPANGFPICLSIQRMLNEKPIEIHRGKLLEEIKKDLLEIENSLNDLNDTKSNAIRRIEIYCSFIRSGVELHAESQIEQINKFKEQFIQEIEKYKNECLTALENRKEYNLETIEKLNEIKEFHENTNKYLTQPKSLEDLEISKFIETSRGYINELNIQKEKLNSLVFKEKIIKFYENSAELQPDLVGKISYESTAVRIK